MKTITPRTLYPHLTDKELEIVEEQLERYLALVICICNRLDEEEGHEGVRQKFEQAGTSE